MMRILIAFIVLLGAVYLGTELNYDPGYVLIAINHWTLETSLWVAAFMLLLVFLLAYLLIHCIHKIIHIPAAISRWHHRHLTHKAQETTRKGLIEFSEGYWLKAKNHLIQALPNTDTPLLNYLTAARAAQHMGDSKLRDDYLRQAQQSMPDAKIAVELTQAELQIANHQWEQALATLRHLQDLAPKHPYVLKLLMHLYKDVRDWPQLINLLPELKRQRVLSDEEYTKEQVNAHQQHLQDLIKLDQPQEVQHFFHSLPKTLSHNPELVATYVNYLFTHKDYANADNLLRQGLHKHYDPTLVRLYGLLPGSDAQLAFAESLMKKNPHTAELHLCMGRLCLAQQLWGRAQGYFQEAIALNPTSEAYFELGKLHEQLNEPIKACADFKKGLQSQLGLI